MSNNSYSYLKSSSYNSKSLKSYSLISSNSILPNIFIESLYFYYELIFCN